MQRDSMNDEVKTKSLSIDEWCDMARKGIDVPVRIQLSGYSMQPLIRYKRDYVTIIPLRRQLMISDVVVFKTYDGRFCCHRVSKLNDGRVQTFGDNTVQPDPWMPESSVIGLVTEVERSGKTYSLDCRAARAYGKLHMALFPFRKFKRDVIQLLWKYYVKVFKRKGDK